MEMAQQHEGVVQDYLLDTEEECLNKEKEYSNTNSQTADTRESKIQELTDEKAEFQEELNMKSKEEASSIKTKEPVTKNNGEDYEEEKDKDELESNFGKGCDSSNYQIITKMEESLEKGNRKNPLLLSPVIRHVLKFLNIEDIKNCRRVCREWGSIGKPVLASRAQIFFHKSSPYSYRLPVNFQSCFLDSTSNFSAFKIFGDLRDELDRNRYWTIEELTKFFDAQQKSIKELKLHFIYPEEKLLKKIDLSSWISKSPMVLKDTKHLTKLKIKAYRNDLEIPLHLIAHIKELSMLNCKIHVEAGIKICPIKLKFEAVSFFQDEVKLDRVTLNDIVDLEKLKKLSLPRCDSTKYVLDIWGSANRDKLILDEVEIRSGETSQWAIEHLAMTEVPYSLNSQMNIKELYLFGVGSFDLVNLPTSIENLTLSLSSRSNLLCSQPIVFQDLQYLQICECDNGFSCLTHFMNCPKLTHLKLFACDNIEMKPHWTPKTIKTLAIDCLDIINRSEIKWVDESYWNFETLVVSEFSVAKKLCETKIKVEDFIYYCCHYYHSSLDELLIEFLEHHSRFNFGKRLFIGEIKWDPDWSIQEFESSSFKDHVDTISSFYVFQDGQKGRAISGKAFHELIPKHIDTDKH